ncbi:MAG: AAA family ATPase [Lacipirellulaceae bacterium]
MVPPTSLPADRLAPDPVEAYVEVLLQTRRLYAEAAGRVARQGGGGGTVGGDDDTPATRLDDLHRGLVLKVFLAICGADRAWTLAERQLSEALARHVAGERLDPRRQATLARDAAPSCARLAWPAVVGPFADNPALADLRLQLETLVTRQAHLVARVDGRLDETERVLIKRLGAHVAEALAKPAERMAGACSALGPSGMAASPPSGIGLLGLPRLAGAEPPQRLVRSIAEISAELDALVGLGRVKTEVHALLNFYTLEARRREIGLVVPRTGRGLLFLGNPGTGKTTVAKLLAEGMHSVGELASATVVEIDAAALVSEVPSRVAAKLGQKIDEAAGGMLKLTGAERLLSPQRGLDSAGLAAVGGLVDRMEAHDAPCLLLSGDPRGVESLLADHPRLAAAFPRRVVFDDYTPLEVCQVFGVLLARGGYQVSPGGRLRVMALAGGSARRDGRLPPSARTAQRVFETAVQRMANRLSRESRIDSQRLVTLVEEDFPGASTAARAPLALRFWCPHCGHSRRAGVAVLGTTIGCQRCGQRYAADWGDPA